MAPETLISVIDDDVSLRLALVRLIRSLGYSASAHGSAEDFLASGEARRAGCVITDIQLPGLSGIALKGVLDETKTFLPIIMITALSDTTTLARATGCGVFCLLRKPFEASELIVCLAKALAS